MTWQFFAKRWLGERLPSERYAACLSSRMRSKSICIPGGAGGTRTFSGRATMTVHAGATAYSDPVNLTVSAMADLAIDLYLPGDTLVTTRVRRPQKEVQAPTEPPVASPAPTEHWRLNAMMTKYAKEAL
jgi:hypothetical protein